MGLASARLRFSFLGTSFDKVAEKQGIEGLPQDVSGFQPTDKVRRAGAHNQGFFPTVYLQFLPGIDKVS